MLKRAMIVLAIAGLAFSAALPLWALAGCPMMNANAGAHSCCQRRPAPASTPSTACILHCSSSVGVLVKVQAPQQPVPATDAHAALTAPQHGLLAVASPGAAPETIFDSSGLYLRVRVLRI
ncbi:MAG: hypothetical protein ACLQBJ_01410 [Bryobacteraceae bacterium]